MIVNIRRSGGGQLAAARKQKPDKNGTGTGMYEGHVLYLTRTTHSGHLLQPTVVYVQSFKRENIGPIVRGEEWKEGQEVSKC